MVKIVTDFRVLMQLSYNIKEAKKTGNKQEIEEAQKAHDEYKELILKSEFIQTGHTVGSLDIHNYVKEYYNEVR